MNSCPDWYDRNCTRKTVCRLLFWLRRKVSGGGGGVLNREGGGGGLNKFLSPKRGPLSEKVVKEDLRCSFQFSEKKMVTRDCSKLLFLIS